MKRTLTAATALVVGSAGAVGFAGTAAAISTPEPSETPVDGAEAGAMDTARSGIQTVGDVVGSPDPQLAPAPKAMPPKDGADALGSVTKVLDPQGPLLGELDKQLNSPAAGQLIKTSGSNVAGIPLDGTIGGQPRSGGDPAPANLVEQVAGQDGAVAGLVDDVQSMNKFDRPTGKSAGSPEAGNEPGARDGSDEGSEPAEQQAPGGLNEVVKGVLGPSVDLGTPLG